MAGFTTGFPKGAWTGASGIQIGYAGDYPEDKYDAFTADPVHGNPVNPNQPNQYRQKGSSIGDVPVQIQGDNEFIDYGMGADGWVADNIDMPAFDTPPGTEGRDMAMSPAKRNYPDDAHRQVVQQVFPQVGHGREPFYGTDFNEEDLKAWKDDRYPPNTSISTKLDARFNTENWPTPFDSTTVMPWRNTPEDTSRIPMRRMEQDDRPVFRRVALPGANIKPSGSVYNPTFASNEYLQTRTPIPASYAIPTDPSVSQDALSQSVMDEDQFASVGDWVQ